MSNFQGQSPRCREPRSQLRIVHDVVSPDTYVICDISSWMDAGDDCIHWYLHQLAFPRSVRSAMFIAVVCTMLPRSVRSAMFIAVGYIMLPRSVRSVMFIAVGYTMLPRSVRSVMFIVGCTMLPRSVRSAMFIAVGCYKHCAPNGARAINTTPNLCRYHTCVDANGFHHRLISGVPAGTNQHIAHQYFPCCQIVFSLIEHHCSPSLTAKIISAGTDRSYSERSAIIGSTFVARRAGR